MASGLIGDQGDLSSWNQTKLHQFIQRVIQETRVKPEPALHGHAESVGDGSGTVFKVFHSLGTTDVGVILIDLTTNTQWFPTTADLTVTVLSEHEVKLEFLAGIPGTRQYRVLVILVQE